MSIALTVPDRALKGRRKSYDTSCYLSYDIKNNSVVHMHQIIEFLALKG